MTPEPESGITLKNVYARGVSFGGKIWDEFATLQVGSTDYTATVLYKNAGSPSSMTGHFFVEQNTTSGVIGVGRQSLVVYNGTTYINGAYTDVSFTISPTDSTLASELGSSYVFEAYTEDVSDSRGLVFGIENMEELK